MRVGGLLVTAASSVAIIGLGMGSAQAVTTKDRVVQRAILSQTGATAAPLTGVTSVDGISVKPATTPSGAKLDTFVQEHADGYAQFAVLDRGQSSARFDVDVPAGSRLKALPTGEVVIIDDSDPKQVTIHGAAEAPWAVDALGKQLATTYRVVDGNTVEQVVDTTDAAFPVVADPKWSLGWYWTSPVAYAKYSRSETYRIGFGRSTPVYIASVMCVAVPTGLGVAICAAIVNAMWNDAQITAQQAYRAGRCLTVRMALNGALWAYDSINDRCA